MKQAYLGTGVIFYGRLLLSGFSFRYVLSTLQPPIMSLQLLREIVTETLNKPGTLQKVLR